MHLIGTSRISSLIATTVFGVLSAGCTTHPRNAGPDFAPHLEMSKVDTFQDTSTLVDDPLCRAIEKVAAQVGRGEVSTVKLFLGSDDPEALWPITCQHNGDMRWHQVCPTIMANTSREFIGVFAYQVKSCLAAGGRLDHVETGSPEKVLAGNPPKLMEVAGYLNGAAVRMRALEDQSGYEVALSR